MDANSFMVWLTGLVLGFVGGYFQAWRTARRLERLGVKVRDWDAISMADLMPRATDVTAIEQRTALRQVGR